MMMVTLPSYINEVSSRLSRLRYRADYEQKERERREKEESEDGGGKTVRTTYEILTDKLRQVVRGGAFEQGTR